jgi:hypothetical protein
VLFIRTTREKLKDCTMKERFMDQFKEILVSSFRKELP